MEMKKVKKPFIFFVCIVGTIIFLNTPKTVNTLGNYVIYDSEEKLFEYADLVVTGTVCNDLSEDESVISKVEGNHMVDFYSVSPFKIEKLIKGVSNEKIINVYQPIAITREIAISKTKYTIAGYTEMKKKSKYIIYLEEVSSGYYSVISIDQGKFNVDGTDKDEIKAHSKKEQVKKLKEQALERVKNSIN